MEGFVIDDDGDDVDDYVCVCVCILRVLNCVQEL